MKRLASVILEHSQPCALSGSGAMCSSDAYRSEKNSEVLNTRLAIGSAIASQSKSVIFRHCSKIFKFVTLDCALPNLIQLRVAL
jgi:hypothetical protein